MKRIILKSIENFRHFFIGVHIVPLMTGIVVCNKLSSTNSVDTYFSNSKYYYLEFSGTVKEAKNWEVWPLKNIENAEIVIFSPEYNVMGNLRSDKDGKCVIKLPLFGQFILMVSKPGYITKTIKVDTKLYGNGDASTNYFINFEIDMFEDIPGLDVNVLTKPVATVSYNAYLHCFDYDFKDTDAINDKLKKKYLVYYAAHRDSKTKGYSYYQENKTKGYSNSTQKTTNIVSVKNTQVSKPKPNTQISKKSSASNKRYIEVAKRANVKGSNSVLSNIVYDDKAKKSSTAKAEIQQSVNLVNIDSSDIVFKIQILSIKEYLTPDAKLFKKFGKVNEYTHNGENKYTIGEFKTFVAANKALSEISVNGYRDAFLVAFYKGKRITIDEAKAAKFSSKY